MGCICMSNPNLNSDYFECSFITLRFSSTESETLQFYSPQKSISGYPSLSSSPTSQKTSDSVTIPRLQKPIQPERAYILSGELQKYHPRHSSHFIKRYCVLTQNDFKCYKNSVSFTLNHKPLFSLPLSQIESAS
jgi:hypothetical protein